MSASFFSHEQGQLAYDDAGSGPLVVCLPSLGDLRGEYRFLTPQLVAAGYRVIQMDLRGHGESSTGWSEYSVEGIGRDLLALIHHLDAGPALVIGTSISAAAGVWAAAESAAAAESTAAAKASQAISALVLIGPAVRGSVSPFMQSVYRLLLSRPWAPALWVRYYASLYPTRKPADFTTYLAALRSNLNEPGRIEAMLGLVLAYKAASEDRLSRVNLPVRVIMGSKDPDFKDPEKEARWVSTQLKGDYLMIQGAGHYPHSELPEITGPVVLEFIQSLKNHPEPVYVP